jgi:PadR family transcriptional regulator, regulatory protein PadR
VNAAKPELLRGTLDMLILKIVGLGPSHGYAITQRLRQISNDFFAAHQGPLYPALHRLEDRGWLQAEWRNTDTGREAKFYALTKKGRKQLETEVARLGAACQCHRPDPEVGRVGAQ